MRSMQCLMGVHCLKRGKQIFIYTLPWEGAKRVHVRGVDGDWLGVPREESDSVAGAISSAPTL